MDRANMCVTLGGCSSQGHSALLALQQNPLSGSRGMPKNRVSLSAPILGTWVLLLFYILYCRLFQFICVTCSGIFDNNKFLFMIVCF